MSQVGIDVSDKVFDASMLSSSKRHSRKFSNTASGHRQFIKWVLKNSGSARVCLEATGIYHLQLALALSGHTAIEVMVVNPCSARRFAQARMTRAKTDSIDADGLLQYLQSMPFHQWAAPSDQVLQLQSLVHRLAQLTKEQTRERCRLHASQRAGAHARMAQRDIKAHLKQLQKRIEGMQHHAIELIQNDVQFADDLRIIDSIPGFAELSSMKIIAELGPLSPDLKPPQWVAQAGLDPRPYESGSSVHPPRRISKQGNARLRTALFLPALCAVQHDPNIKAFYESLLVRGKAKMQAITAVMRKLLHAIWGMLHHRQEWDGSKFFKLESLNTA
jgi:transposase